MSPRNWRIAREAEEDDTVVGLAERCGLAVSRAFRWLHRFLETANTVARSLPGIVEADETYVLASRKGDRRLDRKACKRGGPAHKRGTSKGYTPILVAADRGVATRYRDSYLR